MFHLNKILRNYWERTWLLPEFFWQKSKIFASDCKRGHQSKTAVFQLSCQVLIPYSFCYKMRPLILKFCPQKSKNQSLPPSPTDLRSVGETIWIMIKKVTKVSDGNPDTLEFEWIIFRLKFCPKLFHTKIFCEYRKSSNSEIVYNKCNTISI